MDGVGEGLSRNVTEWYAYDTLSWSVRVGCLLLTVNANGDFLLSFGFGWIKTYRAPSPVMSQANTVAGLREGEGNVYLGQRV